MDQTAGEAAKSQSDAGEEELDPGRAARPTSGQDPGRPFDEFHKTQGDAGQKHPLPERQRDDRLAQSGQMPVPLPCKLVQTEKSIRRIRQKKQTDPSQTPGATDPTRHRPNSASRSQSGDVTDTGDARWGPVRKQRYGHDQNRSSKSLERESRQSTRPRLANTTPRLRSSP